MANNAGLINLLSFLFGFTTLIKAGFVETNITAQENPRLAYRFILVVIILYQKINSVILRVWRPVSEHFVYFFNYVNLNGGFRGIILRTFSESLEKPDPMKANYRSLKSFLTGPIELKPKYASAMLKRRLIDDHKTGLQGMTMEQIAAAASMLAYENKDRCTNTVEKEWKMKFVEFFDCYNETQAFIFCDRSEDAQLIVVAFRGTSSLTDLFGTDLSFSWLNTNRMGSVHLGFMKALGLQDSTNFDKGFPLNYNGGSDKPLAYYSIRSALEELISKHVNAEIIVTGHSLGAALAVFFTSLLYYHNKRDLINKIHGVINFGQPRVGDAKFGDNFVRNIGDRFCRMSYRFDMITRIPPEIPIGIMYQHFGSCISYHGWFKGERVKALPNPNYFNFMYWPRMAFESMYDFCLVIKYGKWEGLLAFILRFLRALVPGAAFHDMGNYINAVNWAQISDKMA